MFDVDVVFVCLFIKQALFICHGSRVECPVNVCLVDDVLGLSRVFQSWEDVR